MPQCHLLKGKLFFLTVWFSHAIIQHISHVMLITVEGRESHQVQKSKKAMTRQRHEWDKAVHKRRTDLRHAESGMMQHLTRGSVTACTGQHLRAGTGGHWRSRSWGWQLLVSHRRWFFCAILPGLFRSIRPVTVFLEDLQFLCWLSVFNSDG